MSILKCVMGVAIAVALTACGGGGGNPGVVSGPPLPPVSAPGSAAIVPVPTLTLSFVNAFGIEVTDHRLDQTQPRFLSISLKKSTGGAATYERVVVTFDSAQAVLVPAVNTQLTDASGNLLVRIAPASVDSTAAVVVTAAATVEGTALSKTYNLQNSAGTVLLSGLSVTPISVQKGQSVNVSVGVQVNGATATSNSVAVTFASACGIVSPASALVDSTGHATAVIQTTAVGTPCSVTATATGGGLASNTYVVNAAPVTGIQFVSAAPSLIYQNNSGGVNTSLVTFKVINASAAGVPSILVNASLTNLDGGINFCGSPASATSGPTGEVSFSICAGTLPTTVQVLAALNSDSTVKTSSNALTVQTGLATQRFFDISATELNFYAGGEFTTQYTGNSVLINVYLADRQGNPIPNGTSIVFVSEGGQINSSGLSSCVISAGKCSVSLLGQAYRPLGSNVSGADPRPGRVTVLAYTDGEEYFIDANNNNRFDTGELFEDLGFPYIDKDEDGVFTASYNNLAPNTAESETSYPIPAGSGGKACPLTSNVGLSVLNTCNETWNGYTKVRRKIVIVFSGGELGQPGTYNSSTNPFGYDTTIPLGYRTQVKSKSATQIIVQLSDRDGNPLPSGTGISTNVLPSGTGCTATLFGNVVGNTIEPSIHSATLQGCTSANTVEFIATVTATPNIVSKFSVPVPP